MDIQALKLSLLEQLANTNSPSILEEIKRVFDREGKDWWHELSAEQQKELDASIEEADRGEVIPHKEVITNPDKWL